MRLAAVIALFAVSAYGQTATYNVALTNQVQVFLAGSTNIGTLIVSGGGITSLVNSADSAGVIGGSGANLTIGTSVVASASVDLSSISNSVTALNTGAVLRIGGLMQGGLTNTSASGFVGNGAGLTNLSVPISGLSQLLSYTYTGGEYSVTFAFSNASAVHVAIDNIVTLSPSGTKAFVAQINEARTNYFSYVNTGAGGLGETLRPGLYMYLPAGTNDPGFAALGGRVASHVITKTGATAMSIGSFAGFSDGGGSAASTDITTYTTNLTSGSITQLIFFAQLAGATSIWPIVAGGTITCVAH